MYKITYHLRSFVKEPEPYIHYLECQIRTITFKLICKLFRKRIIWGKNLKIQGWLSVRGPGTVVIGDNVTIGMTVTPWTYSDHAIIRIGNNVFLNGARFACKKKIDIGDDCIIGECRVMDTNFHSTDINRHHPDANVKTEAVEIADNVWIAPDCQILPGAKIGENSVIGINSVVTGEIPSNVMAAGHPAVVKKHLDESCK